MVSAIVGGKLRRMIMQTGDVWLVKDTQLVRMAEETAERSPGLRSYQEWTHVMINYCIKSRMLKNLNETDFL